MFNITRDGMMGIMTAKVNSQHRNLQWIVIIKIAEKVSIETV